MLEVRGGTVTKNESIFGQAVRLIRSQQDDPHSQVQRLSGHVSGFRGISRVTVEQKHHYARQAAIARST